MERLVFSEGTPIPDVAFTHGARWVIDQAREFGGLPLKGKGNNENAHVGTEHIGLSLLHQPAVQDILPPGIPVGEVIFDLADYIQHDLNKPDTTPEGYTTTVAQGLDIAKLMAARDGNDVSSIYLYAGLIESGRGKFLMTLGRYLGFPEDDHEATSQIQEALFQHIPAQSVE